MRKVIDTEKVSSASLDEKLKKLMDKRDPNFIEIESFEDRWAKGIPAEKAFDDLLSYVRGLWKNKVIGYLYLIN